MIGTPTRLFIEVVTALLAVLVLGSGFLVWRLAQSPLSVAFLTPYIEQALSDPASGRRISITDTILIWEPDDRAIAVRALETAVTGADGTVHAIAPELTLRFSLLALLRGRIEVVDVAVLRPDLRLVREADGRWEFGMGVAGPETTSDAPVATAGDPLAPLFDPDARTAGPLASLKSVRIVAAELVLDDRLRSRSWRVPRASVALLRRADGLSVEATLDVALGGGTVQTSVSAVYTRADGRVRGTAAVDRLPVGDLVSRLPELPWLSTLDAAVGGTARFDVARDGRLRDLAVDLTVGEGRVVRPELPGGAIEIAGAALAGRYQAAEDRLTVDQAWVRLGGATLSLKGGATAFEGATRLEGEVRITELPVDELRRYWPAEVAPNPRRWVLANLSRGTAREAVARFAVSRAGLDRPWDLGALQGTMRYDGLRVTYFGQLPAVEQVAGTATFDVKSFNLAITGGSLRRLRVDDAQIAITDLDEKDQKISIDLAIRGPAADALFVLDQQPLGYMRRFGIQPQATGGDVGARLAFRFPLLEKLPIEKVELAAAANIRGARAPKLVRGLDLSEGDFALTLDGNGLDMTGRGKMAGVPLAATWTENFLDSAPFRRRFDVSGTINDAQRRALNLDIDLGVAVQGPVSVSFDYTEIDDRRSSLSGTVDLAPAKLSFDELVWSKPAGKPAVGRFELALADGKFVRLVQAEMEGSGTTFRGSGAFGGDNRLRQLDIERLTFGRTDVAGRLAWQGRDLAVSLSGRSIDFTDLLARENETPPPPAGTPPPPAGPKLTISAKVDKVILKAGQELVAVSARAENDGSSWRAATIEAKVGATPVSAVLLPYERGRELTVLTGDAGAVLKGLGITEYLLGGRLRFVAKFLDTAPVERTLGHLEIDEYRVVKAPVLAELLAVASVAGIPELLTGEGIAFSTLTADFVRGPSLIEVTEARAAGLAMGLTLQGTIRRSDDVVDLTGRIVPIYALNRMIGSIPLLGDILTGGPGGGLIAFTYSVKGPLDNPQISVNPLSGLAPGFLRNLFFERRQPGPSGSTDPQGSGTSQSGTPTSAMTPQGARQ